VELFLRARNVLDADGSVVIVILRDVPRYRVVGALLARFGWLPTRENAMRTLPML
jgi:hypothetical protein